MQRRETLHSIEMNNHPQKIGGSGCSVPLTSNANNIVCGDPKMSSCNFKTPISPDIAKLPGACADGFEPIELGDVCDWNADGIAASNREPSPEPGPLIRTLALARSPSTTSNHDSSERPARTMTLKTSARRGSGRPVSPQAVRAVSNLPRKACA